jgi:flagellar biosynthesis/type III secretory pathway protein FliH
MSGIIKLGDHAADHARVRPFGLDALAPPLSRLEEERDRLRLQIGILESELRQKDSALTGSRAEVERAFVRGNAEGHAAGLSEAQDLQTERVAVLESTALQAQKHLTESLVSLERLAALLARETLDIVLGDPLHRADAVSKIVGAQTSKFEKSALLNITLSHADFPDKKSLSDLAKRIDVPAVRLGTNDELASGACMMTLRLGSLDVGIDQQWGVLRDLLGEIAESEDVA